MKIATGHQITNDEVIHDFKEVRFIAEDGRTMFEIRVMHDGRSVEIRGVDCCKVNGVMYCEALEVTPRFSNCIEVRTKKYGE